MKTRRLTLLFFIFFLCNSNFIFATNGNSEKLMRVVMRSIGHQVLLKSNDESSLVMPIEKIENTYKITFENNLSIKPNDLIETIDSIFIANQVNNNYFVEVEQCETKKVSYSYYFKNQQSQTDIPCKTRELPENCYNLLITLDGGLNSAENNYIVPFTVLILIILFIIFVKIRANLKNKVKPENVINLGKYSFNKNSLELKFNSETLELTSKEANLLMTLHQSVNEVVERDVLLQKVWGDEGDYIGRTLDVFISKLRKKLVLDPNIKIINVRGVGYKLIMC